MAWPVLFSTLDARHKKVRDGSLVTTAEPESMSDQEVTELASDGAKSKRSNIMGEPIQTMSEPESQADEEIDELASSGGEGYEQLGRQAEVQLCLDGSFSPEGSSEPLGEANRTLLESAFLEMEAVASQASSELAAIVWATADKTCLSESYIVQRWNATTRFTRLVEHARSPAPMVQVKLSTDRPSNVNHQKPLNSSEQTSLPVLAGPETLQQEGARKVELKLRGLLIKRAMAVKLPLRSRSGLRWSNLLQILADNGCYLDNYPDITLPGTGRIRGLPIAEMENLICALQSDAHRCDFKKYKSRSGKHIYELKNSLAPVVIGAPPKDRSQNSRRVYLDGKIDNGGYEMCSDHLECRRVHSQSALLG
ncbi:hypothetical protein F5887DRAFT_1082899 [Amanita rubescens]|nr:hypothetical protein F5887DRAFT_1082899 [Amanita rubescens]